MVKATEILYISSQHSHLSSYSGSAKKINHEINSFKRYFGKATFTSIKGKNLINGIFKIIKCRNSVIFLRNPGIYLLAIEFFLPLLIIKGNYLIIEIPTPISAIWKEIKNSNLTNIRKIFSLISFKYFFPRIFHYFSIIIHRATDSKEFLPRTKIINNRILMMGNPIKVSSYNISSMKEYNRHSITLISVAYNSSKHGYDRLIESIYQFKKSQSFKDNKLKIKYHCVGPGPELEKLKKLSYELKLEEEVIFHGMLDNKDLDSIYDEAQLGIGPLGLHRVGLTDSSYLKTREYFARGIPVIGGLDIDIKKTKYYLDIPQNEDIFKLHDLFNFYNSIYHVNLNKSIRKYAIDTFDIDSKVDIIMKKINHGNGRTS